MLTNSIDNASKFTFRGGPITLPTKAGAEIERSITDTGSGVSTESLSYLFDHFYQVDASRAGGEIQSARPGLAIVKEIVEAHGGRISVRSELGHETTFGIHLPLATY